MLCRRRCRRSRRGVLEPRRTPKLGLLLLADGDLALGDLLEGHRQVVLRARLDERRRKIVERPLAELVGVVVDLPRSLGSCDHERVAGAADVGEQIVETWMHHRAGSLPASSRTTISVSRSTAR